MIPPRWTVVVEFHSRGHIRRGTVLGLAEPVPGLMGLAIAVDPDGEVQFVGPRLCRLVDAYTADQLKF